MANLNITYRVTGRYKAGSAVTAYHLVGEDGSQIAASKERVIYMIGKGQIENMRIQSSGDEMIPRGKGINLNDLPIFDINKQEFRNNRASQIAASTSVTPKKNSGVNPMGQLTLIKRIEYKTNCMGYVVTDFSGNERQLSRKKIFELAAQKLISNAVVHKYTPKGSNSYQLILRGADCELAKLPKVTVDRYGNVIDPEKISQEKKVLMRALRMRRAGILYDNKKSLKMTFEPMDFILCGINGVLRVVKSGDAEKMFIMSNEGKAAVCDEFLDNLELYPVELFGAQAKTIRPDQVAKWPIVEVTRNK